MNQETYTIRQMTRKDIDIAIEWAALEGWNPGLHDAECFFTADPTGFLIGEINNEPVATISVITYGTSFSFLGFYIVKPEYRGQGYGLQIWNAGLTRCAGRVIGLDGVVSQQENYKKSGFTFAYRNIRYEGKGGGEMPTDTGLVKLSSHSFEEVYAYDQLFFPDDRRAFLQKWLEQPVGKAIGIVRDDQLCGMGVVRTCCTGYKIGPLYADTPNEADILFRALKAYVPDKEPIFLDVPEKNHNAVSLAEDYSMTVSFETARMYKGKHPELPVERLYGVTTFELG